MRRFDPLKSRAFVRLPRLSPTDANHGLIVHKYGGTSMGSTERIRNVAKRVAKWARAGHQMVVVPSAMSGETNRLLGWPRSCLPPQHRPALRELDAIAATGEQVSVGLLALALQAEGMQAVSYGGWQVPIQTDSAFTKARIESIDDQRVRADLAAGKVVIITGFQGIDARATSPRWAAAAGHLGRGRGRGDEGRRVPDLHRRGRRLHHRPAHRARGAPPAHHQLRGDARDGQPGQQGAADPLGGVRRQVPRAAACAVELHALGHPIDEEAARAP
jgi:hypothetical protein